MHIAVHKPRCACSLSFADIAYWPVFQQSAHKSGHLFHLGGLKKSRDEDNKSGPNSYLRRSGSTEIRGCATPRAGSWGSVDKGQCCRCQPYRLENPSRPPERPPSLCLPADSRLGRLGDYRSERSRRDKI